MGGQVAVSSGGVSQRIAETARLAGLGRKDVIITGALVLYGRGEKEEAKRLLRRSHVTNGDLARYAPRFMHGDTIILRRA